VSQPAKAVSQTLLGTTKTGKPRQRIQWSEEMNTFIMRQYCIITKLETMKIRYGSELNNNSNKSNYN
jgi:hypothetical protein